MSKLFLEVEIPGNAKTYEFSADSAMTVGKVKGKILEQVAAVENRDIFSDRNEVLFCSVELEGLLQDHEVLRDVGVRSGHRIILL